MAIADAQDNRLMDGRLGMQQGGLARTPERVFVYCSTCPIMFAASVVNNFIGWELGLGEVR